MNNALINPRNKPTQGPKMIAPKAIGTSDKLMLTGPNAIAFPIY